MTDPEITALAREFSKEHDDSTIAYHAAKDVIRFLLRRFCLVEKEAVRKQFESAEKLIDTHNYNKQCIGVGSRGVLERLFPYLGKEVEE